MSLEDATNKVKSLAESTDALEASVKFVFDNDCIFIDGNNNNAVSNENSDADCTIAMELSDFNDMLSGDLDPTAAFMGGKMQIEGDMSIAMKLTTFFS